MIDTDFECAGKYSHCAIYFGDTDETPMMPENYIQYTRYVLGGLRVYTES